VGDRGASRVAVVLRNNSAGRWFCLLHKVTDRASLKRAGPSAHVVRSGLPILIGLAAEGRGAIHVKTIPPSQSEGGAPERAREILRSRCSLRMTMLAVPHGHATGKPLGSRCLLGTANPRRGTQGKPAYAKAPAGQVPRLTLFARDCQSSSDWQQRGECPASAGNGVSVLPLRH
jgi:hypothetical protein